MTIIGASAIDAFVIRADAHTTGINEELYKRLGGTGTPPNRYQDMYIMVIPDTGPTRFIKTTYGPKSSLDPA